MLTNGEIRRALAAAGLPLAMIVVEAVEIEVEPGAVDFDNEAHKLPRRFVSVPTFHASPPPLNVPDQSR